MNKRLTWFWMSAVLVNLVFATGGFSQNIPSPGDGICAGDFDHNGQYHAKGSQYYYVTGGKTYKCIACGDCTPVGAKKGSGGTTGMPVFPGGGAGSSEQLAQQMMVNLLGNLIQQALAPPPDNTAALQQQAALEKAKKEAEQRERLAKWQQMEQARADRQHREKDQLRSMLDVAPFEAGSGGTFDVVDWAGPEGGFQARDAGIYDTSGFSLMKRLACANDFAQRARDASQSGDHVNARYLNEQAENVMAGRKTEMECRCDDLPDVPQTPDSPAPVDMAAYETIISRVQQDVEQLQVIKLRLREIEEKKEAAREQIEKIREDMAIQNRPADADKKTPEPPEDDLLELEAQKLLEEAQNELAALEKDEQGLTEQQSELENGLKAVQEQLQAAGTGR